MCDNEQRQTKNRQTDSQDAKGKSNINDSKFKRNNCFLTNNIVGANADDTDSKYMRRALELAVKGIGLTSPNPMVGAVIVKNGHIIGEGYHERYGQPHAERNALSSCIENPEGSTIYVTLEPCCHHGKQPPCTDAILQSGISRVVIGSADPNPLVAGKGIRILKDHGIQVTENILREECDNINKIFFHYITKKAPYVIMKYAMTMDGKIAAYNGVSKWITGETARHHVHELRHQCSAIMAGVGTIIIDDPQLTCRIEGGRNPVRIICDSKLRTPVSSNVVSTAKDVLTLIATCCTDVQKHLPYVTAGCQIAVVPETNGHVDLPSLMKMLGEKKIDSVLLEGGAELNWAALKSGIVQKVMAYVAPKLLGGKSAKNPVEGQGFPSPSSAIPLKVSCIRQLGDDFLIESDVV